MPGRAVVIGGGAIGAAAAHYLSLDGWQVTLLDRGEVGAGCSYANACLIVPSHSAPLPGPRAIGQLIRWLRTPDSPVYIKPRLDPGFLGWGWRFLRACRAEPARHGFEALLALSRASLDLYEELRGAGVTFGFERRGLLHVYLSEAGVAAAVHEAEGLRAQGFQVRVLSAPQTREFEPAVGPRVRGGMFVEGDAHGDCHAYVRALAAGLPARGARVLTGRPVARILADAGRVRGVLAAAPDEEILADLVVLAAGVQTPGLAAPLGLRVPIQPAKGYSCTIPAPARKPAVPILIEERRVIITPLGDRLRFAGTLELAGHVEGINDIRYRAVVRAAREVLGDGVRVEQEEAWGGFRPLAPDGLPIIGRAPGIDGLILATGHAMLGFTQSPITGRIVADLAAGRPSPVPLEPFRPDRF